MKNCRLCNIEKDLKEFSTKSVCKTCDAARHKVYRDKNINTYRENALKVYHANKDKETNKNRIKEYNKSYYEENKVDLIKHTSEWNKKNAAHRKSYLAEYRKEYEQINAKKISDRKKKYRLQNPDLLRERKRKWERNNPDKVRKTKHNRRAREHNLLHTFTIEQWNECLEYFNHECAYCGKTGGLHQDHFIPVHSDGHYTRDNIIPSCKSCNSSKNDKNFFDWYPFHESVTIDRMRKILIYLEVAKQTQTNSKLAI